MKNKKEIVQMFKICLNVQLLRFEILHMVENWKKRYPPDFLHC